MESVNYKIKCGILETHPLKNRTNVPNYKIILLELLVKKPRVLDIKPRISKAKAAFNKQNSPFTKQLDLI
jgi:hypothetical protein